MSKRAYTPLMGQEAFEMGIEELLTAITVCWVCKPRTPSLLLFYASIDIMAWLGCPEFQVGTGEKRTGVKRDDFIEWADKYLLPSAGLACSAMDLWGARCGLLHTYMSESDLSRQGNAKELWYAFGNGQAGDIQKVKSHDAVELQFEYLFHALYSGIESFKQSLSNDPKKASLAYKRASKFFGYISAGVINALLAQRVVDDKATSSIAGRLREEGKAKQCLEKS